MAQNIQYALTKQRIDQSMRMRGALSSYNKLNQFLREHGELLSYKRPKLTFFVWVTDEDAVKDANYVEKQLFIKYGEPDNRQHESYHTPKAFDYYNEMFAWNLEGSIEQHLAFIDSLGKFPRFRPGPAIYITTVADFWLKDTNKERDMQSNAIAFLSPTSNKTSLTLNFPQSIIDDDFVQYRDNLQSNCPVVLEDKYFYIRKSTKPNVYTFRKAY